MIDDFVSNYCQAKVMEAKVGEGSLLTSIDLIDYLDKRLVTKHLKYFLLEYMKSEEFGPKNQIKWQDNENLQD